jgi:Ferritin-like
MIRIKKSIIDAVRTAVTPQDLYPALQLAVSLELSTIPTYLCGLFTLKEAGAGQINANLAEIIQSVVDEEMLHMCIAANTMIALGGAPTMNTATTVPHYPGPLPGDTDDGLIVQLLPFSVEAAVLNTYMRIEEPDMIVEPSGPNKIPLAPAPPPPPGQFQSIGDFYQAIITKLQKLPEDSINPDPTSPNQMNQVVNVFYTTPPQPAAITNIDSAVAALSIIIDQGEGSSASPEEIDPVDPDETAAHFYRFAEIVMGRSIVVSGDSYDFSGSPVTFDATPSGVYNMFPNPTLAAMQPLLSASDFQICQNFSAAYTDLLDALTGVFNGNPQGIQHVINKDMFPLATKASKVLAIQAGTTGYTAGLCFEIFRLTL